MKEKERDLEAMRTEIAGLKTSVAEMSSSRAGVEAALSDTKSEPEAAAAGQQIADLLRDCKDNAK